MINILFCENCGEQHDGSYGSGRFCCEECARSYSSKHVSEEGRKRQIEALIDPEMRLKMLENRKIKSEEKRNKKLNHKHKKAGISKYLSTFRPVDIGLLGEYAAINAFMMMGIPVFNHCNDFGTDLIAIFDGKCNKIQVKTSTQHGPDYSNILFTLENNTYKIKDGHVITKRIIYDKSVVDYFVLFDPIFSRLFILKNENVGHTFTIRYTPPENNQINHVNYADDYDLFAYFDEDNKELREYLISSNIIDM